MTKGNGAETFAARFTLAAARALVVSFLLSGPLLLRVDGSWPERLDAWFAGGAILFLPMLLITWLIPRARRGLRGVVGETSARDTALWLAVCWGLTTCVLGVLGALLKAKTHHRGLGGATFGVLAIAVLAGSGLVTGRVIAAARKLREHRAGAAVAAVGLGFVALGPLLLLVATIGSHAPLAAGVQLRATVFDLLFACFLFGIIFFREVPLASWTRLRRIVPLLVIAVFLMGAMRIASPKVGAHIQAAGGVPGLFFWALERWTDRDGDGSGSHFGGRDCDEGNPNRYPGAPEFPHDGIDSDCDGRDSLARGLRKKVASPRATAAASGAKAANTVAAAVSSSASQVASSAPAVVKASAPAAGTSEEVTKPDIVVVTLDTVRADHTSLYGYKRSTSPRLKKLAERGLVFEHSYAVATDTRRALMPIVSGRPLSKTARTKLTWPAVKREVNTVAERMKSAGYSTGAVSSFTWLRRDLGFHQGFDHFDERPFRKSHPERQSTGVMAVQAAQEIYSKLAAKDEPLFLWVHLFDAHEKYLHHAAFDFGDSKTDLYDGEIAYVDQQLGFLLDHVRAGARDKRTVWVIYGSHGEAFNEHGVYGHGTELYNEMLRVPLVMAGPGIKVGRYVTDAVSTLDLAPTILDFAGASLDGVYGESLKNIALGDHRKERPPVVAHAWKRVCVIDIPLKLMVFRRNKKRDRVLLFDLDADPGERHDISDKRREDLKRLQAIHKKTG